MLDDYSYEIFQIVKLIKGQSKMVVREWEEGARKMVFI